MGYLSNINQQAPGGKLGGILTINLVRKSEIASIPAPFNGDVNGPVVLIDGASFVQWIVSYQSAGITSTSRKSKEGPSKTNTVAFHLPLDRPGIRKMLELAEEDEFVVVVQYPNGTQKIFGTLQAPMLFEFSHDSGRKAADSNHNNCSFYYQGPDNSYFYNADAPGNPAGPAPVIVKFNGEAIASLTPGQTLNIISDYSLSEYFTTE